MSIEEPHKVEKSCPPFAYSPALMMIGTATAAIYLSVISPRTASADESLCVVLPALHLLYVVSVIYALLGYRFGLPRLMLIVSPLSALIAVVDAYIAWTNMDYLFGTVDSSFRFPNDWRDAALMLLRATTLRSPLWLLFWTGATLRSFRGFEDEFEKTHPQSLWWRGGLVLATLSLVMIILCWSAKLRANNPLPLAAGISAFFMIVGIGLVTVEIPEQWTKPFRETRSTQSVISSSWAYLVAGATALGVLHAIAISW